MLAALQIKRVLAGSILSSPAITICVYQRNRKAIKSAETARPAPGNTTASAADAATNATAASAATASATTASATTASAATASAATAAAGFLHHAANRSGVLLVEDMEGRQTDVREFLHTKGELVSRRDVQRRLSRRCNRGGCAARHGKSQSSGTQCRYRGLGHALAFRHLLHSWHSSDPPYLVKIF
jgi:hypothetical protein